MRRTVFGYPRLIRAPLLAVGFGATSVFVTACQSGKRNVADGKTTETKGRIESAYGDVTGNDNKKAEGQTDQATGKVQKAVGRAQEKLDTTVKKVTP